MKHNEYNDLMMLKVKVDVILYFSYYFSYMPWKDQIQQHSFKLSLGPHPLISTEDIHFQKAGQKYVALSLIKEESFLNSWALHTLFKQEQIVHLSGIIFCSRLLHIKSIYV